MIGSFVKRVMPGSIALLKKLHTCFNTAIRYLREAAGCRQRRSQEDVRKIPSYSDVRWTSMFKLTDVTGTRVENAQKR